MVKKFLSCRLGPDWLALGVPSVCVLAQIPKPYFEKDSELGIPLHVSQFDTAVKARQSTSSTLHKKTVPLLLLDMT